MNEGAAGEFDTAICFSDANRVDVCFCPFLMNIDQKRVNVTIELSVWVLGMTVLYWWW